MKDHAAIQPRVHFLYEWVERKGEAVLEFPPGIINTTAFICKLDIKMCV